MYKVVLSNKVEFECLPDQSVLDAAISNGVALEYSCRNGRCGVCLAGIVEGQAHSIASPHYFESKEQDHRKVLTCCSSPLTDLRLDIPDLGEIGLIKPLTFPCRVNSLELLNDEVRFLELRLPPSADFKFVTGQYIDLIKGDIRRSYSIANAPRNDGLIELQVKKVTDGVMSDYLFNEAAENDLLRLEGPFGTFSVRDDSSKNIVLMATGTGISPIKAFLESFDHAQINKNIYVVWGGRVSKDLYYDFKNIKTDFSFIPVLSREKAEGCAFGYIQNAVLDIGINLIDTTVYACGSKLMINDASRLLMANGLKPENFHSDAFVSSN